MDSPTLNLAPDPNLYFYLTMSKKLDPLFSLLALGCFAFLFLISANAQATSEPCDGIQDYFVDGINNTENGKTLFVYRRNLHELTKLSGNDGSSGFKIDKLEEIYVELLARIELSRFLQEDISVLVDSKGNQITVAKIHQNPFALNFIKTYICQYKEPKSALLFVGTIRN